MSYPQGYLYQPSASLALYSCPAYSTSVISGPRTDELGRSSSGSAFSPYAGSTAFSAPSPGYNSHLQYGTDPAAAAAAAAFSSYVGSPYDHTPGMASSLGYHPYAAPLGSYPYGDPAYRKNATRDATATLKAWLNEHRKNPYPTKGEKIMLAIITKMTLTQVSTWFANARRRLKKENKMTWTPRNRSEDEEEEENIDLEKNDDEEPAKLEEKEDPETGQLGPADPKGVGGSKEPDGASSDSDCKESAEQTPRKEASAGLTSPPLLHCGSAAGRLLLQAHHHHHHHHQQQLLHPGTVSEDPPPPLPSQYRPASTDLQPGLPSSHGTSVIHTSQAPPQAAVPGPLSKPKLWSLAEIATSADKAKEGGGGSSSSGSSGGETPPQTPSGLSGAAAAAQSPTARSPSSAPCPFPSGAPSVLPRPLYYAASPFYPGYTNYASFGHLHGNAAQAAAPSPHFNGLNQSLLNRAEGLAKDAKALRSHQYDFSRESPYELKKGTSHI